jgi:hypothetical protein
MTVMKATLLGLLCASDPVPLLLLTCTLLQEYGCRYYFKQPKSNGIMGTAVPPAKAMDIYFKQSHAMTLPDRENTFP